MVKISIFGAGGIYPKHIIYIKKVEAQKEEARRKDFEKYIGVKQVNTKVKNDKLIKSNPDIKLLLENQSVDVNKMIAVEELSELQKEICKDLRGFDRREEIKEEMADVYICLQLLKEIYNFDDEELEEEYKRKMDRNIKRIKVKNKEMK
nr:MAG TPA: NTP-PPase-like protein [Caudoviricetes sp.]